MILPVSIPSSSGVELLISVGDDTIEIKEKGVKNNAWANSDFRTTGTVVGVGTTHRYGDSASRRKSFGGFPFRHDTPAVG